MGKTTTQAKADAEAKTTPAADETLERDTEAKVNAAKEEAAEIVKEAQERAAAILAEAEAKAKEAHADDTQGTTAPAAPAKDPNEELVPIRLFKDNERYKDAVFVAVNGRRWQIKRGETVMVPKFVADVLEQSMAQDAATASLIERESSEYKAKADALGIG